MFGPQLDFQASQGTEWVFRVSFLLIQLNSTFYCGFPDPQVLDFNKLLCATDQLS